MANTFRKIYKKTGNSGTSSDYQLVGNIGVNGVELDIMKGASSSTDGELGLVPKPSAGSSERYLSANGTFKSIDAVGDLSWLNTPTKKDLVAAVNDAYGVATTNKELIGNTDISSIGDGTIKGNIALLAKKYRGASFLQGLFDHRSIVIEGVENCYGVILLITNQNINDVITFNGWSNSPSIKHNAGTGVTCNLNQSQKKITIIMPSSYNHGFVLLSGGIVWMDTDVTVTCHGDNWG